MLARKISRAKWQRKEYLQPNEIGADVVTCCMRTRGNSLSWWRCTGESTDVAEVALALACGMEKFEKIDVVILPNADIERLGITTEVTEGNTPVRELRSRHIDLRHLDLDRLSGLAKTLAPGIRSGESVVMFTKKDLQTMVHDAVSNHRVSPEELKEELRQQLDEYVRASRDEPAERGDETDR